MPTFNIIKQSEFKETFRNLSIKSIFDLNIENIKETFTGNIDIENKDWNIGVIFGASGTGKSTIAKELFKDCVIDFLYGKESVIDEMPKNKTLEEITKTFNSVGFATVWSFLKPYSVLSQGEKMRVDLSRCILEDREIIVFDEYTSVINREVAKFGSYALSKAIRKRNKKFIAVSCHDDILEWLEPDWIFDTNKMEFRYIRGQLRRPDIKLDIYECNRDWWKYFSKYHYLNHSLNTSAKTFLGVWENRPIAFISVLHFPHPKAKNIKKVHRLVVLPDFQGLGIGAKFMSEIAKLYLKENYRFRITTSNASLLALKNIKGWRLDKILRNRPPGKTSSEKALHKTNSALKYTFNFEYLGTNLN